MQYFGGKARTANEIVKVLEAHRTTDEQLFVEPFVGGANIISKMSGNRIGYDIHPQLIEMYKALQQGWEPPEIVSEQQHKEAKQGLYSPQLTAFIGFGCCFGGGYFRGYARNAKGKNYAAIAKRSLAKKIVTMPLSSVTFESKDYKQAHF